MFNKDDLQNADIIDVTGTSVPEEQFQSYLRQGFDILNLIRSEHIKPILERTSEIFKMNWLTSEDCFKRRSELITVIDRTYKIKSKRRWEAIAFLNEARKINDDIIRILKEK